MKGKARDAPALSVLQYNVFAANSGFDQARTLRQIDHIKRLSPDIVCLQECFFREVEESLRVHLTDYHAFSSTHVSKQHTPLRFLFSLFFLVVSLVLVGVHHAVAPPSPPLHVLLPVLVFVTTVTSLVGLPAVLPYFALPICPVIREIINGNGMGLVVLVRRRLVVDPHVAFTCHQFKEQAPGHNLTPSGLLITWFNMTYLSRGAMCVPLRLRVHGRSLTALVCCAHLATGVENKARFRQVRELVSLFEQEIETHKPDTLILGGDTNADGFQPEMQWMRCDTGGNLRDSFLEKHGDLLACKYSGNTWHHTNSLTNGNLLEPDQRIDYVLYRNVGSVGLECVESGIVLDEQPCDSDHFGVLSTFSLTHKP